MTQEQANWEWIDARVKRLEEHCFNPVKELTDEEILPIYTEYSTYYDDQRLFVDIYGFARAILRKAQEK